MKLYVGLLGLVSGLSAVAASSILLPSEKYYPFNTPISNGRRFWRQLALRHGIAVPRMIRKTSPFHSLYPAPIFPVPINIPQQIYQPNGFSRQVRQQYGVQIYPQPPYASVYPQPPPPQIFQPAPVIGFGAQSGAGDWCGANGACVANAQCAGPEPLCRCKVPYIRRGKSCLPY